MTKIINFANRYAELKAGILPLKGPGLNRLAKLREQPEVNQPEAYFRY